MIFFCIIYIRNCLLEYKFFICFIGNVYILLQSDIIQINMYFIDLELLMLILNIQKNVGVYFYVFEVNISYLMLLLVYMYSDNEFLFLIILNKYLIKVGCRYMYEILYCKMKL